MPKLKDAVLGSANGRFDVATWEAIVIFFSQRWWRQVWTILETKAVAEKLRIMYDNGLHDILWCRLAVVVRVLLFFLPREGSVSAPEHALLCTLRNSLESFQALSILHNINSCGHDGSCSPEGEYRAQDMRPLQDMKLLSLLQRFRNAQAMDPRDKVYALLAIANDTEAVNLDPNYSLTWQQVYIRLAKYYIELQDCLSIITMSAFCPKTLEELPSWVPDWRFVSEANTLNSFPPEIPYNTCLFGKGEPRVSEDLKLLYVTGFRVDQIKVKRKISKKKRCTLHMWGPNAEREWKYIQRTWLQSCPPPYEPKVDLCWGTPVAYHDAPLNADKDPDAEDLGHATRSRHSPFSDDGLLLQGRAFCTTVKGRTGLIPKEARVGDIICILASLPVPVVLRHAGKRKWYLIGECYVTGIMDGEVLEDLVEDEVRPRMFVLR
ncbi:MAG: hypothetical protein MMC33_003896 [Icmadophila ericetorum]|nr:hypothetical protein [Icmadophila ericetorum]